MSQYQDCQFLRQSDWTGQQVGADPNESAMRW